MIASRPVLVVETEFIIALGIQSVLDGLDATSILASGAADAQHKASEWSGAVLAVVELEQARPDLIQLARKLSQSGVLVLGISADSRLANGMPELPGIPILIKPVPDNELEAAILSRLGQNPLPEVT